MINPIDSFERVAALYDKIAELGVVEAIVSCLETFKNYCLHV